MKRLFKSILAVALCFVMLLGSVASGGEGIAELLEQFSVKASAYNTGDDYPQKYKDYALDAILDEWKFYNRECTSFVAWCLYSRNGLSGFSNWYGGVNFGNAKTWVGAAQSIGITVNQTPAVGAVACWTSGTYGHVAWVKSVNSNGTVNIEEYNYNVSGGFGSRNGITASYYIHFKDIVHTHDYSASVSITKAPTQTSTGTRVKTCSCGKTLTQTIPAIQYTTSLKEGIYSVSCKFNSNLWMATNTNSEYNGNVWVCSERYDDQYWLFRKNSDGTYTIENALYNGYCLDNANASLFNSNNIRVWEDNGSDAQKFYIVPSGNYYKLVNKVSYNNVDVENVTGNLNDICGGTNISQFEDNGGENQLWKLTLSNPSLNISSTGVTVSVGGTAIVDCTFSRETYGKRISYSISDTSICSAQWGDWSGMKCTLKITGKSSGSTVIIVTAKDSNTGIIYDVKEIGVKVPDNTSPKSSISSTNNVATSQTVTLSISDNTGLAGYYWGTSSTYSNNTYTSVSGTSKTITKTVSAAGTYYLTAKDTSGNISSTVSKTFYNTTLNANGGSVSPSNVITMSGNSFTLPTPTRSGYTFTGWNTTSGGTGTSYSETYKPTSSTTLYAQWKQNDTTNPSGNISSTNSVASSQTVTLSLSDNVGLAGYYWGTSSTYSNNTYTSVSGTSKTITKTVSAAGTYYLTAKDTSGNISSTVSKTFYNTTLNANGGSVSPSNVITMSGNSFPLPTPTRSGYIFTGWNTASGGTGTSYSGTYKPTSSTTLYAQWKQNDTTKPSGNISSTNSVASSQIVTLSLSDNVGLAGYYWGTSPDFYNNSYYSASGTSQSVFKTISTVGTYYLTVQDAAGNLKEIGSISFYKTTLNAGDGTVNPPYVLTPSGNTFALPAAKRDGYKFSSWNTSEKGDGASYAAGESYVATQNVTLFAQWSLNHNHSYSNSVKAPTCTEKGYTTYTCDICGYSYKADYVAALGHKDENQDNRCDVCNATIEPLSSTELCVASARTIDYRTKVTIKATASGVPEVYYLAIFIAGKEVKRGTNTEVSYEYGELKGDLSYTVKVIDKDGNVQKDGNNKVLSEEGGKITCKAGFIQKLVAFFKGLFGSLPKVEVKP